MPATSELTHLEVLSMIWKYGNVEGLVVHAVVNLQNESKRVREHSTL